MSESGFETSSLEEVEAVLDGMENPTSEDVWHGTLQYSDRAIASVAAARAGTGGFIPARNLGQASFEAHDIAVAGLNSMAVSWVFAQGDSGMFDLAAPTLPTPVEAGVYSYLFIVTQQAGGDGSPFYGVFLADDDFYALRTQDSAVGLSSEYPTGVLPIVVPAWFSAAGSAFQATIVNGGVSGSDTFDALLYVQRIA